MIPIRPRPVRYGQSISLLNNEGGATTTEVQSHLKKGMNRHVARSGVGRRQKACDSFKNPAIKSGPWRLRDRSFDDQDHKALTHLRSDPITTVLECHFYEARMLQKEGEKRRLSAFLFNFNGRDCTSIKYHLFVEILAP